MKRLVEAYDQPDTSANPTLPEFAFFHDMERSWQMFTWCEAFNWEFLPETGGLSAQPVAMMEDLITWRNLAHTMKAIVDKRKGKDKS